MNENPCKQCKNWCSCPERSRGMLCTAYIKYNPYYREDKRKERKKYIMSGNPDLIFTSGRKDCHRSQVHRWR